MSSDAERGRGSQEDLPVLDEHDAAGRAAGQAVLGQHARARWRLRRAKAEVPLRIAPRDEADRSLAERARAIEQDDAAHIRHRIRSGHSRSGAWDLRLEAMTGENGSSPGRFANRPYSEAKFTEPHKVCKHQKDYAPVCSGVFNC